MRKGPPKKMVNDGSTKQLLTGAFYVGNGWVAGGCWDDEITGDDWDHSRKFPA